MAKHKKRQTKNLLINTVHGERMTLKTFEHYHDIAATTKVRGKGIGFAGVDAKLALAGAIPHKLFCCILEHCINHS